MKGLQHQHQHQHQHRNRCDPFALERGLPHNDDEKSERDTRYAFETTPALVETAHANLQEQGDEIILISKTIKPSRHHSLDLNSLPDEDDLRTSFNLAMTAAINEERHGQHRPAASGNEFNDYNADLLLNASKLGALLNVARTKGIAYLDRSQESSRKRMESALHIARQSVVPSDSQSRRKTQPVEPPSPQTKPVHFAHRNRPKSVRGPGNNSSSSTNTTSALRALAGENVNSDRDLSQFAAPAEVAPEPSPTADRLIQAITFELATEPPLQPPSPITTARDALSDINAPSLSSGSQLSFVRQAKAIPPPTFVSVCLPSVPVTQTISHAHLLGNLDLGPRAHPQPSPASASSQTGGVGEGDRRGADIPSEALLGLEPGRPSPAAHSSSSSPPPPSSSSLAQQVCDLLRQDEQVPTLVLPDDILARKQTRPIRTPSAGAGRPRSRVGTGGMRDIPPRVSASSVVHKTTLDFPAVPTPPARRETHSHAGFSPRVRAQGYPFPAGFKPQVSPRSTAEELPPTHTPPHTLPGLRPIHADEYVWPHTHERQGGEEEGEEVREGGGASPVEERKQSASAAETCKQRVLYLAHRIVQDLDPSPRDTASSSSSPRACDVPVSIVSAPEHLQRLIAEERERQRRLRGQGDGSAEGEGGGEAQGVDLALPLDLVRAMDKQLQRYSELQRRPQSPSTHRPLPSPSPAEEKDEKDEDEEEEGRGGGQGAVLGLSAPPHEDDRVFGEDLVLRWRSFLDHKDDASPAPAASAKVKPNVQPIALDRAVGGGEGGGGGGGTAPPPSRGSARGGSRPTSSRRVETKVLQLDALAVAELFNAPSSQSADNSGFDEDYMHVNSILAEYTASSPGNPQDRVVRLNPKVVSRRIDRPSPAGRRRAAGAGEREGGDREGGGLAMHARPVSMQWRRKGRAGTREGRK